MPKSIPQRPGYEISGAWQPAQSVGGDYYDVLEFDDNSVGLCIADVAGKGLPAALLMSNLQAAVRGLASPALAPDGLCSRLNSLVCHNTGADRFITFFYAHLDGPAGRLHYANAGHNPPILLHADGSHERLQAGGGVLGVFPRHKFASGAAQLAPGDRLILYTDGVTEACDVAGEEFGEVRLLRLLQEHRTAAASALQAKILAVAGEFSRGHWHDDATLLVLAVRGNRKSPRKRLAEAIPRRFWHGGRATRITGSSASVSPPKQQSDRGEPAQCRRREAYGRQTGCGRSVLSDRYR